MKKVAVIVAGGSGTRMCAEIPKQFILVAGKPILCHTISVFRRAIDGVHIMVVLPQDWMEFWQTECKKNNFDAGDEIIAGGSERFYSVKNALNSAPANSIVAIHDAVRPLVSIETIQRAFDLAIEHGAVVPVVPANESLRKVLDDSTSVSVSRACYRVVQTPQVFMSEILLKAYDVEFNQNFTDDASVVEHAGNQIVLSMGNPENLKITTPIDLQLAELMLTKN